MSAEVVPFLPVEVTQRLKEVEAKLAEAEDALFRAKLRLDELESEEHYRKFYQDLATRRLHQIIMLERMLEWMTVKY